VEIFVPKKWSMAGEKRMYVGLDFHYISIQAIRQNVHGL
jgi:hypothetical protein